jgi:hypothetical protein
MNISGKFVQLLPEIKGEGRNGPWTRQDFILETDEQYPKKVCISVWNNKVDAKSLKAGDPVTMEITVESREYNGRWYTDVKAVGMIAGKPKEYGVAQQAPDTFSHNSVPDDVAAAEDSGDDLPF